jgi:hypothetical protein
MVFDLCRGRENTGNCSAHFAPAPSYPLSQDKAGAKEWLAKAAAMRPVGLEEKASHAEAKKMLASL